MALFDIGLSNHWDQAVGAGANLRILYDIYYDLSLSNFYHQRYAVTGNLIIAKLSWETKQYELRVTWSLAHIIIRYDFSESTQCLPMLLPDLFAIALVESRILMHLDLEPIELPGWRVLSANESLSLIEWDN